jgi:hypothetical protein
VSGSRLNFFKYHALVHMIRPFFELGHYDSAATGEGLHKYVKKWYRDKTNHRPDGEVPFQAQVLTAVI